MKAFPARTELVAEVAKEFLKETISRFGLPGSLSSGNGSTYGSQVKKEKTSDLGIKWTTHSAWRPPLSGKAEKSNQTLKWALAKLCHETQEYWIKLLLTTLLHL